MDELREKYLQGKLSEAEQEAFVEGLSSQEKEELATELGIRAGLESGFRNELRKKVAGFEERGAKIQRINPTYISIAASIFLVSSLVLYFTRDQQSLFEQYYEVYPNYEVTVVRGEENPSLREKAYLSYDNEIFEDAIKLFNSLDTLQSADRFFRGVCYIQMSDYEKALVDFSEVIEAHDLDYEPPAVWYTALIQLKLENRDEAIPLLETLSQGSSEFASTSTKLLDQI